jgi:hypothetical protein
MSEQFGPGQKVPRSGVYRVTHDSDHAVPHDVTCIFGKTFPPCVHCGEAPRFTLVRYAKDVESEDNFTGQNPAAA